MANILLSDHGPAAVHQTVGKNWVYNFINRHDELKARFSRRYNHQRTKCEDLKIIRECFDRVERTIMQCGIPREDIYNFDETGFAMGLVATAKAIKRAETAGRPVLIQPGNREWVQPLNASTPQDGLYHLA
jgi:hypothetical protein